MSSLQILGYANSKPATVLVDRTSPCSMASAAFLFSNSLNTSLDSKGRHQASLTLSIPSQGGYYTSTNFRVKSSARCSVDVVLGADWLVAVRATIAVNVLRHPAPETVENLAEGHGWTADGELEMS